LLFLKTENCFMGIEIEKKYRLTHEQYERLLRRLREHETVNEGEEFEENTLYAGGQLDVTRQVLRLRRAGGRAIFTYKERYPSTAAIKRQREDETIVEDAKALAAILEALGFKPVLVYEKRRTTYRLKDTELVVDELPFGLFMEIEGEEQAIVQVEQLLDLTEVEAEMASYPELAERYGEKRGGITEARFQLSLPEA
jgi:adenylate cyclase class 2